MPNPSACITVLSRGRSKDLLKRTRHTLKYCEYTALPVFLVVPIKELKAYDDYAETFNCELIGVPNTYTFASTCDHLINNMTGLFDTTIIMHDDLYFYRRNTLDSKALTPADFFEFNDIVESLLKPFTTSPVAITSLVPCKHAYNEYTDVKANTKLDAIFACNNGIVSNFEWKWEHDYLSHYNLILEMLYAGQNVMQINEFCYNYAVNASNPSIGGIAEYINDEDKQQAMQALAKKFPDVVKLRTTYISEDDRFKHSLNFYFKKTFGDREI